MKYLIMIYSSLPGWDQLSPDEQMAVGRGHLALTEELGATGELVVSEGLGDRTLATTVAVREGRTLTTDGPYAEAKEHLAGFYLVEVADHARAVELAAKVPDARYGQVELRPVLDMSGWEM